MSITLYMFIFLKLHLHTSIFTSCPQIVLSQELLISFPNELMSSEFYSNLSLFLVQKYYFYFFIFVAILILTITLIFKSKSQIQVPKQSPKWKIQRKGTGTGADTIILQATTPLFHLKCHTSVEKRPSMTFPDLPWPTITYYDLLCTFMTFYDLLWLSMTFYDLLWPSMTFYDLLTWAQINSHLKLRGF